MKNRLNKHGKICPLPINIYTQKDGCFKKEKDTNFYTKLGRKHLDHLFTFANWFFFVEIII